MRNKNYVDNSQGREPFKFPTPFNIKVDKNYKFTSKNKFEKRIQYINVTIVYVVFKPILNNFFKFKVVGKENISKLDTGAITVCNHIHYLDCVMLANAFWNREIYFLSLKNNFEIPVIRHIIKWLRAVPIPDTLSGYIELHNQLSEKVKTGSLFHIYPEGSLRPGCKTLRDFKKGAFSFALLYDVPIVPCIIKINKTKRKRQTELIILEPIYANKELSKKEQIDQLEQEVMNSMKACL